MTSSFGSARQGRRLIRHSVGQRQDDFLRREEQRPAQAMRLVAHRRANLVRAYRCIMPADPKEKYKDKVAEVGLR